MPAHDAAALLNPRNIVLVGASDRPRHWSGRVHANLERFGYAGGVYPVNPRREEIWGRRCYPDVASLPEAPDHVLCFVPADVALGILEDAAAAGARSALVFAGGFGEGGDPEGRDRARRLRAVIEKTGLALCGPNCMGNVAAPSRAVTLPDDGLERLEAGPTAVVAQSGGLCVALNRILAERGLMPSYLISAGNQAGLAAGDYVRYLAREPQVRAILLYLEEVVRAEDFLAACAEADAAGKAVVAVKIGGSEQGRAAALAHTGALVGSLEAFDARAGAAGVVRVDCLEEAVEALEYLVHAERAKGPGVAVMTNSGALKSLVSESAARAGITFAPLAETTRTRLTEALGPEVRPANPLDTRQTVTTDKYVACLDALGADPGVDLLLLAEELPLVPGIERKELNLAGIAEWTAKGAPVPVALFAPVNVAPTEHARALRATLAHLPVLSEPDRTFRVVGRLIDQAARRARAGTGETAPVAQKASAALRAAAGRAGPEGGALDEARSMELLAAFGVPVGRAETAADAAGAVAAAERLGYPVVVKALSRDLAHKTEAGAVALGLGDADAVCRACEAVAANVRRSRPEAGVDGFRVAAQEDTRAGAELALGIARDPEMGPVVMFGTGGIALELYKDVAFGRPGLTEAEAGAMIDATRAAALLAGFRGAPALDRDAVTAAIVAMGRLAAAGAGIEAVDVNPLLARPAGQGAVALDALVVMRGKAAPEW